MLMILFSIFNILNYTPMVEKYIYKLSQTNTVQDYMLPDLYQEGMLGLTLARNNYNSSKKVNFGYYCRPYVKHRIYNYYYEHRTNGIREPQRVRMNRFNFNKYWKDQIDNGEVTEEEVMKVMDISRKTLEIIKEPHPFINNVENYFGLENVMYLKKNLN
jgi:DNA-directed RNA polymerase specialized sigma subunit